jgi:enolase
MPVLKSIACRKILNSHVEFTNEFIIELADGSVGAAGSPQGETISIYEDRRFSVDPGMIIKRLEAGGCIGREIDQEGFDEYLQREIASIGRNNAYGLSLAFFNATKGIRSLSELFDIPRTRLTPPRLCLNILNGGWHAYTNPVLSDFSELMIVAKSHDLEDVIGDHNEIQRVVKEKLLAQTKTVVSGNPVNCFATPDNRECIDFLLKIVDSLGLSDKFDLMIDASAGDLWKDRQYHLSITDGSSRSSEQFHEYWLDIIRQYSLRFLEDPFREQDVDSWRRLTSSQFSCWIIGDNFYSSDAGRIEAGAVDGCTHGVIIKPNQAGTVTAVRRAVEAARRTGQIAITSHRSISTEETFISTLTCLSGVEYIKIGPLQTDYSSVVRLNEIIRLTE